MSNVLGETLKGPRFSGMLCLIHSCLVSNSFKSLLYLLSFSVSTSINIFYVLPWSLFLPSFSPHWKTTKFGLTFLFFLKRKFYFQCCSYTSVFLVLLTFFKINLIKEFVLFCFLSPMLMETPNWLFFTFLLVCASATICPELRPLGSIQENKLSKGKECLCGT